MEDKSATIQIMIIKTPKGYRVIPPSPAVAKGDTIAWRNYTHGNIEVLLTSLFPGVKGAPAENGDVDVIINANAPAGFYPYAVYAAEANDMAVGDSAPGVIIKR